MMKVIREIDAEKAIYLCDCGNEYVAVKEKVRLGSCRNCGCLRREVTRARSLKHGHKTSTYRSRAYTAWVNMKKRCGTPGDRDYKNWGGRGIFVCDEWLNSFPNFLRDMGEPPPKHTIDRIDNNKGYFKENCRWVTRAQQSLNKRNNVRYQAFGEFLTLSEWSRKTGIGRITLLKRLQRGVPVEQALSCKGYLKFT